MADVVTVGPVNVRIVKNTSLIPNEILAHVMGMTAFKGARTSDKASLAKHNPSLTLTVPVTVNDLLLPNHVSAFCPFPDFPAVLAYLGPGQRLEAVITFGEGCGAQHARFCPVRTCVATHDDTGDCLFFADDCGVNDVEQAFVASLDILLKGLEQVATQICNSPTGTTATSTAKRARSLPL